MSKVSPTDIRPARAEDAPRVSLLLKQLGYDWSPEAIAPYLATPPADYRFYVVDWAGDVVAFLAIARHFYFAEMRFILRIMALCVEASHRSQGIGAALLAHGIAQARQQDPTLAQIEVTCACHRDQAYRFYERQGFQRQGIRLIKSH